MAQEQNVAHTKQFKTTKLTKNYTSPPFDVAISYTGSAKVNVKIDKPIAIVEAKSNTAFTVNPIDVGVAKITFYTGSFENSPTIIEEIELHIEKGLLNVKPDRQTRKIGVEFPIITTKYKISGYKQPADEADFLHLPVAYFNPVYNDAQVGVYEDGVLVRGGEHPRYEFEYKVATLVVQGSVIIPPDSNEKRYGDPDFELVESSKGIVSIEFVSNTPKIMTVSDKTGKWMASIKGVGVASLTSTAIDEAGNKQVENIEIVVHKAILEIKADNKWKYVDEELPELTYAIKGLVYDETQEVLSPISLYTDATQYSPIGIYPISIQGGEGANYETIRNKGDLNVITYNFLGLKINGEPHDIRFPYDMGCGDSKEQYVEVLIKKDAKLDVPGYVVDKDHGFRVTTEKPMVKKIPFTVGPPNGSSDGSSLESYELTIERRFIFDDLVIMRWNNTLSVVTDPEKLFGYTIEGYQWYKDDMPIVGATKQYYSAGTGAEAVLDENAKYHVEFKMTTGETLRTCQQQVKLSNHQYAVTVSPNPVRVGESVTLTTNLSLEELQGAMATVYNINGIFIKDVAITGQTTTFPVSNKVGMHLIKFTTKDGFTQTHKVLVK